MLEKIKENLKSYLQKEFHHNWDVIVYKNQIIGSCLDEFVFLFEKDMKWYFTCQDMPMDLIITLQNIVLSTEKEYQSNLIANNILKGNSAFLNSESSFDKEVQQYITNKLDSQENEVIENEER